MNKTVFLLSPNSEDDLDSSVISYSMALGYLGAYAEKAGWKVIVRDCYCKNWDFTKEQIKTVLAKDRPSVVGMNCITMNRMAVYKLIDLIKKINPSIKVIVGGVHPTIFPEHFLINHKADIIVLHEGEETFEELLNNFANNKSIKKLKG